MKTGAKIFGALSGLLILFLFVGLLLPGQWEARVETVIPAPSDFVFPLVDSLPAWSAWSPMPEKGLTYFGPPRGVGAGFRWDDDQYGKGEMTVVGGERGREVRYEVLVEGGAMKISGTIRLIPRPEGTRVLWTESGDFGRNPLLGYTALRMEKAQSGAMQESLDALGRLILGG